MTDKECQAERAKLDVQIQESRVRDAERGYNEGFKKLKAEFETQVNELKECVVRAKLDLEKGKVYLQSAVSNLERGFDK